MPRLLVHVEGPTERNFVNELLAPHLIRHGYTQVGARIIGHARRNTYRGGSGPWPEVRREILAHLQQDPACVVTTMVDFYGMSPK